MHQLLDVAGLLDHSGRTYDAVGELVGHSALVIIGLGMGLNLDELEVGLLMLQLHFLVFRVYFHLLQFRLGLHVQLLFFNRLVQTMLQLDLKLFDGLVVYLRLLLERYLKLVDSLLKGVI